MSSSLTVNVFDGTRRPFSASVDILYRVFDGTTKEIAEPMKRTASLTFNVPFHNNLNDNHRVIVSAKGWQQSGYWPIKLSPQEPQILDLMLIPKNPIFDFTQAQWDRIKLALPFLGNGISDSAGRDRYNDLMESKPESLASLLNLTSSLAQVKFPDGSKLLEYIKEMKWDVSFVQDRFFAYCDARVIGIVRDAAERGLFVGDRTPIAFHPGATASWKQLQFHEANVQLTFHEQDTKNIGGVNCVVIEPDINYYKGLISHTLLEVLPNTFRRLLKNHCPSRVGVW